MEVWNTTSGSELVLANYASYVELDTSSGILTFKKFNEAIDLFIKVKATDGLSWSPETVSHQVRLVIEEIIIADSSFLIPSIEDTTTTDENTTTSNSTSDDGPHFEN